MPTLKNNKIAIGKLTLYVGLAATAVQFISSLLLVNILELDAVAAFLFGSTLAISTKLIILTKMFNIKSRPKDQLLYAISSFILIAFLSFINNEINLISNSELVIVFCVLSSIFSFIMSFFLNQFMTSRNLIQL